MNKLIKSKYISVVFGKNVEWETKLYRFVMQYCFLCCIIFGISKLTDRQYIISIALLAAAIASAVLFYISFKIKDLRNIFVGTLIIINVLFLPGTYLRTGGARGIIPLWFLMAVVLVFLLLNGVRLYIVLACTVIADIAVYHYERTNPLGVGVNLSLHDQIFYSCMSVLFIGMVLGLLVKYQLGKLANERSLAEQRGRELEEASDSKSLFFANMSHEIRTPINTIIGLNEMILRDDVSDEVAENAINIQNASKILLALINDILDMSKIESGKMEIVPAQYETASMFSDIVNIVWTRAHQKGLEFKIDISEDIPSMLYGDEIRIKQILTNILTNAVKYTEKGSVTLTITGEQLNENSIRLKYSVEDTGIGIKKDSLDELFTVFKRFDASKTKKIEGTGLGLSISKQLVDMMGGSIKVDSIYGKGSNFTITLDQQIIDHNPLGALRNSSRSGASNREKYERSFEAPDARVLVVDDNEMNLMVVKKLLRDTKVQVDLVSSGKECLEKTLYNNYDVILMDHLMPEMDGEETMQAIRSRNEGFCQKVPIIALTANVMTNAVKLYQDKGFDGYLAKPISGGLLEACLLKFLPGDLVEYSNVTEDDIVPQLNSLTFHRKKKRIALCAECVCDLPRELVEEYDIKIMHYYVTTQEGRFVDPTEIGSKELMEYLGKGNIAHSAPAPIEEYEAFMADRLTEADQVLFITVSDNLTNVGANIAVQAAKNFGNVTVISSNQLSSGMGIFVLRAAQIIQDDVELAETIKILTNFRNSIQTSFIIGSMDAMYQNKQASKRLRDICRSLSIHPILKMKNNNMVFDGIAMGSWEHTAKKYIRSRFSFNKARIDTKLLFITHVGLNINQLDMIKKEVSKYVQFKNIRVQEASAAISSNCGVGTFGLFFTKLKA